MINPKERNMFTADQLESTWKSMRDFERDNFGLKFGADFPEIIATLKQSKQFMNLGVITTMLCALSMSGMAKEMEGSLNKEQHAKDMMERPTALHATFAELFYLGYVLGKQSAEVTHLESLVSSNE